MKSFWFPVLDLNVNDLLRGNHLLLLLLRLRV